MAKALVFMFLGALLFGFITSSPKSSGEAVEVVSFVELASEKDDEFRYCELEVKGADGKPKKLKFKAKKNVVASSVESFVRSMLPSF